jgi:hypothetical protein
MRLRGGAFSRWSLGCEFARPLSSAHPGLNLTHKSWMYSAGAGGNPVKNACGIRLRVSSIRYGGEFQMFSPVFPPAPLIPHEVGAPGRLKTAGFRIHSMVSGAKAANLWVKFRPWGAVEPAVRALGKGRGPAAGRIRTRIFSARLRMREYARPLSGGKQGPAGPSFPADRGRANSPTQGPAGKRRAGENIWNSPP